MTELMYDSGHAERWACFSGDYNPVHFDLTAAAELNQQGLIAHGMRVIADIKNRLLIQEEYKAHQHSQMIKFSAKFEKPVICGTKYFFYSQLCDKKTVFNLVDHSTDSVRIRGYISQAVPPKSDDFISSRIVTWDSQEKTSFGWPAEIEKNYATFISSLMFRELLKSQVLFTVDFIHEGTHIHSLPDVLLCKKVLQTHYELYCSPALIMRNAWNDEVLSISIEKPFITGNESYGWIVQVKVVAKVNEEVQMHMSVTLKISEKR